jgi:hypothetical protein
VTHSETHKKDCFLSKLSHFELSERSRFKKIKIFFIQKDIERVLKAYQIRNSQLEKSLIKERDSLLSKENEVLRLQAYMKDLNDRFESKLRL